MATFTFYTCQFSPLTVVQGECFPVCFRKSLGRLYAARHQTSEKFSKRKITPWYDE